MADDTKSGLEGLMKDDVQNGVNPEGKDSGSQPGPDSSSQVSKGTWITVLPEYLRKGVEADKYANLNEYIRDLQSKVNGSVHDDKAFTEGWDKYVEEMKTSGEMLPESIQTVLKESKVDAETAKKLSKAVSEYGADTLKKSADAAKNEMRDFLNTEWKGKFEENNEVLKQGLKLFGKNHPALMDKANRRGSVFTPEFVQLMVDYANLDKALNRDRNSQEGGNAPKQDASNPFGLKNI